MNAHFPQSELGRAEAYTLVSTDQQYLVPKVSIYIPLMKDFHVSQLTLAQSLTKLTRKPSCKHEVARITLLNKLI